MCTFNTPFGRYRFKRLPYGICSAPEVFQRRIRQLFDSVEGVDVYVDDILVWGSTIVSHNRRLKTVLDIARKNSLKFNINKCSFGLEELKYLGHIISSSGLKPDPDKIAAIVNMREPENKKDVEKFLGMITYLGKFIPHMSCITEPLRVLLKKNIAWHWESEQKKCVFYVKENINSNASSEVLFRKRTY